MWSEYTERARFGAVLMLNVKVSRPSLTLFLSVCVHVSLVCVCVCVSVLWEMPAQPVQQVTKLSRDNKNNTAMSRRRRAKKEQAKEE